MRKRWQVVAVTRRRPDGIGVPGIRHLWSTHWTWWGAWREAMRMDAQPPHFVHFTYVVERCSTAAPCEDRAN